MPGAKNRTKGNVKPSSSSQAARLLAETGATPTGFIGFGGGSGIAAYVPASETFDDADSTLDSDFRMILRKVTKRDATTKIKALGEFGMLCQEKDDACLVAVLPFWPRIYNKMAMDVDHKVRESAQTAMTALVTRVGRNLAPYLKSVIGVWILSCNDTYPGVASAARQAFQTAFPENKQKDVIIFCKQVLVEYMIDNVCNQTAATLSDPKTTEEDEREAKYHRVLSCSLKGLHQLLQTLPSAELEGVKGHFRGLLNEGKFWKLAKSPVHKVQSDLFWLLSSLCQVLPEMAVEYVAKLSPLILGSIDSTEVMVIGGIWNAVLSLVKYLPACWEHINWQKAFWPKLRNVLESGCQVAPSIIAPNLLPLLSRLPVDLAGGAKVFYPKLLEHGKLGMLKALTGSDFGMAYVECLQFALKEILSKDPSATDIAGSIVLDQLEALVEASLLESALSFHSSAIYSKVAAFVTSMEQKKDSIWLASLFWEKLTAAVLESFDSLDTSGDRYLRSDRLVVFVKAVLSEGKIAAVASEEKRAISALGPDDVELSSLKKAFVDKIALQSYQAYRVQGRGIFLGLLADLAHLYFPLSSVKLIAQAAEDTVETSHDKPQTALHLLPVGIFKEDFACPYTSVVRKIVLPALSGAGDEKLEAVDHAITILFACLAHLSELHSTVVWEAAFKSADNTRALCSLIERALDRKDSMPQAATWLSSPQLTACLSQLVTAVTAHHGAREEELAQAWKVLSLVLSASSNKEPVFPRACIEEIIVGVHRELVRLSAMQLPPPEVQRALQFVARASAIFFQSLEMSLTLPATKDLILALLHTDLDSACLKDSVTEKLVREAWGAGVGAVVANTGGFISKDGVLDHACCLIRQAAITRMLSYKEYKHIMRIVQDFLQTASDSLPADKSISGGSPNPCIVEILRLLAAQIQKPCETEKILHHLCMEGQMCLVSLEKALEGNAEHSNLTRTIFFSLYNIQLLHYSQAGTLKADMAEMAPTAASPIKSSPAIKEPEKRGNILLLSRKWEAEDIGILLEAVQALCLTRIILDIERHVETDLVEAVDELEKLAVPFLGHMPAASKEEMIKIALNRAFDKGGVSCLTLAHLLQILEAQVTGLIIEKESLSPGGEEESEGQETADKEEVVCVHVQILERCIKCVVGCQSRESCSDARQMLVPQMSAAVLLELLKRQVLAFLRLGVDSSSLDMTTACLRMVVSCFLYLPQDKCEEVVQQVVDCLARIKDCRDTAEDQFLFTCELTKKSSSCLSLNVAVMQCMAVLVCKGHRILTPDLWDFILCSLVSWIESLIESKLSLSSTVSMKTFAVAVFRLMVAVARCIHQQVSTNPTSFPPNLETEWKEFFSQGLFSALLPLFVRLIEEDGSKEQEPGRCVVLTALGSALCLCPKENIHDHKLPPKYLACEDASPLPDSLQSLLNHLCPLLTSTLRAVQVTAYTLLDRVIADLPAYEKEQKVDEGQKEEVFRSPPAMLMKVIEDGAAAMDIVLADVDIEKCVAMVPGTEEHQFALGYLLAWQLALAYFHGASPELRAEYAAYFKQNRFVEQLLNHLFRLMPHSTTAVTPRLCIEISSSRPQPLVPVNSPGLAKTEATDTDSSFTSSETGMSPDESGCAEEIQKLACHVYTHCLQVVPALVRQWWKDLDRKSAAYVDRFTSKNVSPYLCKTEIQSVQELGSSIEDITVKACRATREVTATYQMDEVNIEIQILLPENYPLGKISVSSQRRVGVNQSQWDRWLLQLNVFLQHQNGSIMEGLRLWKKNIDKRFEGVEECMVCYAVVHGTSFQLPRVQCRTCRKKFHSACLYKWFSTSQNSTCPLCRNLF